MFTPVNILSQVFRNSEARERTVRRKAAAALLLACLVSGGCATRKAWVETVGNDTVRVDSVTARIDNPEPEIYPTSYTSEPWTPFRRDQYQNIQYKDISLQHVLGIAMANSQVLRDLGGTVLRNPELVRTDFTTALQAADPRLGTEAALSAFDAQLRTTAYFANNDRTYNNAFFAGGTTTFVQDLNDYTVELSKLTATGSRMSFRNVTNYDNNNAPGNTFRNAWDTYVEGELRQPLLQGGGLQFNRIAGPGNAPGVYNGILIAKVGNDLTQIEFEMAVRDYVSDVVNAYWDLYLAYRQLDSRTEAMEKARSAWEKLKDREDQDAIRVAMAREQYYRFKAEADEAISGRVVQGTQGRNGSTGGTVRGVDGVQVAERRLRLLVGLPVADGEMLRPVDEPEEARMIFDWSSVTDEALMGRPELRKQQLRVRQRELELLAARNFLNPRLDAVGRYRFRGFGDDLAGQNTSALQDLTTGNLQEWFVGAEFNVPIGFRKAHAAVSHAELMVSRERAIHREQQKTVVHDVMNSVGEAERAWEACENIMNRYLAAREVLSALEANLAAGEEVDVDRLFDSQRRVVEAEVEFFRARVEYAVALKNVHLEKNSLMAYNNLHIYDGAVPLTITTDAPTQQAPASTAMPLTTPAIRTVSRDVETFTEAGADPLPSYSGQESGFSKVELSDNLSRFGDSDGESGRSTETISSDADADYPRNFEDGEISLIPDVIPEE